MSRDVNSSRQQPVLTADQQEAWLAYMRVTLRLSYEMNRQLQTDSDLTLADYDVLNALADSPGTRLRLGVLAARIGWERSRLSHHLQRMGERGLVERVESTSDRRATDAVLTDAGESALVAATPGHAELIRTVFFDRLDPALVAPLRAALEQIHEQLLVHGTLPAPGPPQRRLTGLEVEG